MVFSDWLIVYDATVHSFTLPCLVVIGVSNIFSGVIALSRLSYFTTISLSSLSKVIVHALDQFIAEYSSNCTSEGVSHNSASLSSLNVNANCQGLIVLELVILVVPGVSLRNCSKSSDMRLRSLILSGLSAVSLIPTAFPVGGHPACTFDSTFRPCSCKYIRLFIISSCI
jgi:hypothetical protein